ncbi:MAG: ribokinase [Acidobacteriaceae bacterium]|nr:ribokinase [Acidobacteriaceae bacterium]MBV9781783.1 ribokinase [Acidobacteriaceae bacterium]
MPQPSMTHSPRIVVVGSINIDLTTFTDNFPQPGETIFAREFNLGFGGKGANQAVAAKLCGAEVSMLARVGDDLFGPASIQNLASYGIDTSRVLVTPDVSSGVAPIFVDSSGQNRILVVKGANDRLSSSDVEAASDILRRADFIVLQLEIPLETVYHTLRFARAHGIRTILNPAPGRPLDFSELSSADYLIPNETEAEIVSAMPVRSIDQARACAQRLLDAGVQRVIVTLGVNGALFAAPGRVEHVPGFNVEAFDTTGAGDAFIGSLAHFLATGREEIEAVSRANLYAALSTLGVGTQKSFVKMDRFEAEWSSRHRTAP